MYLLPGGSRRCIASCKMHEPGNAAGTRWCDLRHPRTDDRNLLAGDFVRKQTVTTTCFLVPVISCENMKHSGIPVENMI